MKKLFYLPSIFFLAITSCNSDDASTTLTTEKNIEQLLTAKWYMSEFEFFNSQNGELLQSIIPNSCTYLGYMDLQANGKEIIAYYSEQNDCTEEQHSGTWVFDAVSKEFTITIDANGLQAVYKVIEIDDKFLEMQIIHEGGVRPSESGFDVRVYLEK